jgi:outer membrane protein OmpA-like peptidoglycan-associated protein
MGRMGRARLFAILLVPLVLCRARPAHADDSAPPRTGCAKEYICWDPGLSEPVRVIVRFDARSAVLDAEDRIVLDRLAGLLKDDPSLKRVEVRGHIADESQGDAGTALSQRRAEVVRRYLVDRGVAPERLTAKGYGSTLPVDSSDGGERDRYHRVDFAILRTDQAPPTPPPAATPPPAPTASAPGPGKDRKAKPPALAPSGAANWVRALRAFRWHTRRGDCGSVEFRPPPCRDKLDEHVLIEDPPADPGVLSPGPLIVRAWRLPRRPPGSARVCVYPPVSIDKLYLTWDPGGVIGLVNGEGEHVSDLTIELESCRDAAEQAGEPE